METKTRRKQSLETRRAQIIEAALSCFLESGYNQTGIRAIAQKAGISLGNLYNHFASKNAVLVEIARLELEELAPFRLLLSQHDDPMETLQRFITDYAAYVAQPGNVKITAEILTEAIRNKEIAVLFQKNRTVLVSSLQSLLRAGAEKTVFRTFEDQEGIAELVLDSIEGYAFRTVLNEERPEKDIETLRYFIEQAVT